MGHVTIFQWWRAWLGARTWRELAWTLSALPVALIGLLCVALPFAIGGALAIIVVGLPILAAALSVALRFAAAERWRARALLGLVVERPDRGRPAGGLRDVDAWRAAAYQVVSLPVGALGFAIATLGWGAGAAALSYPLWYRAQPAAIGEAPLDRPGQVAAVAAAGLAALLVTPWVVRAVVALQRALITALLATTPTARRLKELAEARSHAVTGSAEMLRRIERDLHDGAQARMAAVAVDLGVARDMLGSHPDPGPARELVDLAYANARTAISELRDLARGIHPAALDHGLDTALATLTARTPIPVDLRVDPQARPERPIAAIVYFCAAELLANAIKHSGARRVTVEVDRRGTGVRLRVRDDGAGGAHPRERGGLAGLRERVGMVDGRLTVDSPPGGPTTVTADLPLRA